MTTELDRQAATEAVLCYEAYGETPSDEDARLIALEYREHIECARRMQRVLDACQRSEKHHSRLSNLTVYSPDDIRDL